VVVPRFTLREEMSTEPSRHLCDAKNGIGRVICRNKFSIERILCHQTQRRKHRRATAVEFINSVPLCRTRLSLSTIYSGY
jgi:hypothetical protein